MRLRPWAGAAVRRWRKNTTGEGYAGKLISLYEELTEEKMNPQRQKKAAEDVSPGIHCALGVA